MISSNSPATASINNSSDEEQIIDWLIDLEKYDGSKGLKVNVGKSKDLGGKIIEVLIESDLNNRFMTNKAKKVKKQVKEMLAKSKRLTTKTIEKISYKQNGLKITGFKFIIAY